MVYFLAVLLVAGAVVAAVAAIRSAVNRRQRLQSQRLRTAPFDDLHDDIVRAIESAGWDKLPEAAALQSRNIHTEKELLEGLESLLAALHQQDKDEGRSGRDSNYFMFHDFGLAQLSEALRDRLGIPQPWQTRPE